MVVQFNLLGGFGASEVSGRPLAFPALKSTVLSNAPDNL
jgi:hypothetical protein